MIVDERQQHPLWIQILKFFLAMIIIGVCQVPLRANAQETKPDSLKEIKRKIDILTEEIERLKLGEVAEQPEVRTSGLGPAASRVYRFKKSGVSIAGYGEIVYENFRESRDNGQPSAAKDQIDYLRNVIYVGYRFSDWILFNSELEFEHASTDKKGEVSVEFGYLELMFSKSFSLRAGMILTPLGIINERHEPSTFFGTLRPQVEQVIIPTTWRTIGVGLYGEMIPFLHYSAYIVEGLNASKFSDTEGIRGGRQSGSKALAENFGLAGKLEYKGIPGSIFGGSFYAGKSGQGLQDSLGTISAATTLLSIHAEYTWKGLELRALYAQVSVEEAGRVSRLTGKTVGSSMTGWYVVVGFDLMPALLPASSHFLAPFLQYEEFNTHASVAENFTPSNENERSIFALGMTYKPHPNVAFKFDYRDNANKASKGIDQWNLALNYLF